MALESTSSPPEFLCKICGSAAKGVHFGVQTCRACAAFFRRTVVLDLKYDCDKGAKCSGTAKTHLCRSCRYRKCVANGMTADNVQWNRDIASSTLKKNSRALKVPDIKETPGWRRREAMAPPAFDLTNIFRKIKRTFSNFELPSDPEYTSKNALEKMEWALKNHKKSRTNKVTMVESYQLGTLVSTWSKMMTSVAEWMMHSEEVRALCAADKYDMFRQIWHYWIRLDLIQMSCETFGERVVQEKILMSSPTEAFRIDNVFIDFSQITDRPSEFVTSMFRPIVNQMFDEVVRPMLALQPCSKETAYLLCFISCKIAIRNCRPSVCEAADALLERVSNDLHEFYAKSLKTNNYAGRLIKFVAVINAFEKVYKERKKMLDLAKLFDVFKTKISEPCFFE